MTVFSGTDFVCNSRDLETQALRQQVELYTFGERVVKHLPHSGRCDNESVSAYNFFSMFIGLTEMALVTHLNMQPLLFPFACL